MNPDPPDRKIEAFARQRMPDAPSNLTAGVWSEIERRRASSGFGWGELLARPYLTLAGLGFAIAMGVVPAFAWASIDPPGSSPNFVASANEPLVPSLSLTPMNQFRFLPAFAITAALGAICLAQKPASRTEIANAAQPQLTVGSDGRVWMVYGQAGDAPPAAHADDQKHKGHQPPSRSGDVLVVSSKDGGATFSQPSKVASVTKLMLGMRRGPRIAAQGDRITVTVIAHELLAFTSTDGGKTWSEPATINEVPTSAREGLHDLAGAADGQLFVTWLDLRNGKMELWGAASKDGGRSWAKNQQVYRSPDKSICECCHPSALFDADGNLAVMWRNSIEGSRDMWLTTRAKGAAQFIAARKLGEGTWKIAGCPMDGGRILALGGGHFGAVFQRNGEVFISRGESAEMNLGKGKQPVAVHTGHAPPMVIWQQGADLVSLASLHGAEPVKHASDARFPSVVALPGGKGVLLAYERGPAKGATTVTVERL